jgi:alkaline phosphatase D
MKKILVLSFAGLILAACATSTPAAQLSAANAPSSPAEALRAFYATQSLRDLPQRPIGAQSLKRDAVLTKIAFGSCMGQDDPAPALRAAAASGADLFVMLGDNVYGDAYSGNMELYELKDAYAALASNPDFQEINAAMPISPSWDDHDFGLNDAGADFSAKEYAETIFEHFWRVPQDDIRRARPGIHFAETYGVEGQTVQLIHLDTRFFRSPLKPTDQRGARGKERYLPDADPAKTLLGDDQWAWLAEELAKPADVKILVSSIQIIADGHGWEAWRQLPAERERLYAMIDDIAPRNLILVSGDRHAAALYRKDGVGAGPLHELTASSLNRSFRTDLPEAEDEAGPFRLGARYFRENFGDIAIDWAGKKAVLTVRDNQGQAVQSVDVPLDL